MIFDYPIIMNLKNHLSIIDICNLSLTCKYYYGILNRIIKEIDLKNLKKREMFLINVLFLKMDFEKKDLAKEDLILLEYVKKYKQNDPNKKPLEIFEIFKNYETNRDIKKLKFSNISNLQKYPMKITPYEYQSALRLELDRVLNEEMKKSLVNSDHNYYDSIKKTFCDQYGMKEKKLIQLDEEFCYRYVGLTPPYNYYAYDSDNDVLNIYDSDSDSDS